MDYYGTWARKEPPWIYNEQLKERRLESKEPTGHEYCQMLIWHFFYFQWTHYSQSDNTMEKSLMPHVQHVVVWCTRMVLFRQNVITSRATRTVSLSSELRLNYSIKLMKVHKICTCVTQCRLWQTSLSKTNCEKHLWNRKSSFYYSKPGSPGFWPLKSRITKSHWGTAVTPRTSQLCCCLTASSSNAWIVLSW